MSRLLATAILTALVAPVFSQAPSASLPATVKDASGAVVAGAAITVVPVNTGIQRTAPSNELGFYALPLLPPGRYDARVQLAGFRTVERKGMELRVDETVTVDFTWEVGPWTEMVTIQGGSAAAANSRGVSEYGD